MNKIIDYTRKHKIKIKFENKYFYQSNNNFIIYINLNYKKYIFIKSTTFNI